MSPVLTAPLMQQPVPDTDWHVARVQLEQVLRTDPDNVEVLTHLGVLAARARQYRKARTTLERALAAAPQDLLARRLLVELLICFGDLDAARGWVTTGPTQRSGDPDWQAAVDAMAQLTPPAAGQRPPGSEGRHLPDPAARRLGRSPAQPGHHPALPGRAPGHEVPDLRGRPRRAAVSRPGRPAGRAGRGVAGSSRRRPTQAASSTAPAI